MAVATIMSSSSGTKKMKQRGADPPGRSKLVDKQGAEVVPSLEEEPLAERRRSKSRGRSMGRSSSSRALRRGTSSHSAKSRSTRSLGASKGNSNSERSKSLGRDERGRSKSRGRTKGTSEEGRSKSRRRSERDGAVERGRSKSRGCLEQKRVEGSKPSFAKDESGEQVSEIVSPSRTSKTQSISASDMTPRTRPGLNRRTSPSIGKLDTPLVPPGEAAIQIDTISETPATQRGVDRSRSVSAHCESKTNAISPRRSKSTEEIKVSPKRKLVNTASTVSKGDNTPSVPTTIIPQHDPNESDISDIANLSKEFQSAQNDFSEPIKIISSSATTDPNNMHHGDANIVSSEPLQATGTSKTVKARPAQSKSDLQSRDATKNGMQTIVASASLFVTILEGRLLAPMQRNMLGIKKHSHPFVETYVDSKLLGTTTIAHRTVNPIWKSGNSFSSHYDGATAKEKASRNEDIELRVFHLGNGGASTFMGAVHIPLLSQGRAEWYPVQQRSILDDTLFCAKASGELKVHVNFTAQSYPDLKPGHELPIPSNSEISINLTWSGGPSLETSCVALDRKNGHVLWKECIYFANRINMSSSVARPEVQGQHDTITKDSLVFDFGTVPEAVAAFYVVLTMQDKFSTLTDLQSFQATVRNERTHEGIGRLTCNFPNKDTSAVLLRLARTTRGGTHGWKLKPIIRGYKVFREFGSFLPQLQEFSSDILPFIGTPAERTALMRCGDSLRLLDYVAFPVPTRLVIGFFWKVKNKEALKVATSLLDEQLREVDAIHRTQPGAPDLGVLYSGGSDEFEKFEILFSQIAEEVHYICFVLGPYSRQKVDDIQNVACHVVNPAKGAELARCTLSKFESSPTKSEWNFTILGLSSSETTFGGRLNEMRTHIFENPLEPAISLPHPRLLKSVMPSPIPLPPPRKLALSEAVEMRNLNFA